MNGSLVGISTKLLLIITSFLLVAMGQPASIPWFGLLASGFGYALFWRVLLDFSSKKYRFWISVAWFFTIQLVQLYWFVSHPFLYIWAVYLSLCFGVALQFGVIGLLITYTSLSRVDRLLLIPAVWTILEWSRLYFMSGFSWNPVGIALAGNIYSLQIASLGGVLGLSFWVILVNLLALRAWMVDRFKFKATTLWIITLVTPYIYGGLQLNIHSSQTTDKILKTLLVQTAFSPEEISGPKDYKSMIDQVVHEWRQILLITKKFQGQQIDLIVLPEFVVPFGTYGTIYPLNVVLQAFFEILGPESIHQLPSTNWPFHGIQQTKDGLQIMVNNAYWVQGLANIFEADILVGLEDGEEVGPNEYKYYSSALFLHPLGEKFYAERYDKRVLVPMGEYIPFAIFNDLAKRYGVFGSFTHGVEAKVMNCKNVKFSPSICYEETFAHIIREGREKGAELFVNITSDVWYPDSRLPRQHLEHSRLRTVENGVPLIRACNTGITCAIDSFGKDIAILGGDKPEIVEWVADALLVKMPIYSYKTPYTLFGDKIIISFCLLIFIINLFFLGKKNSKD